MVLAVMGQYLRSIEEGSGALKEGSGSSVSVFLSREERK